MKIRSIMNHNAILCRPEDSLNTAAQLMWDGDCGAIPVVDQDGGITGIVTDRDVCMAAYTTGRSLKEIPVSQAMARRVYVCGPDDTIESVEHTMSQHRIRRVPVVDDQKRPIGMISINDVARRAGEGSDRLLEKGLVTLIASISEPWPKPSQARARERLERQN